MHWSTPYTIALAALSQFSEANSVDGWTSIISTSGALKGNDGSLWLQQSGSSAHQSITNGDYIDATGFLPDATTYAQQTSHSTTVTTTTGFTFGGSGTIDFATLSGQFSLSQAIAVTTSQTETTTIVIKCNGQRGKIQFQPLFTRFDGNLCSNDFCWGDSSKVAYGSAFIPETSDSGGQLANFRIQCEDGSVPTKRSRIAFTA